MITCRFRRRISHSSYTYLHVHATILDQTAIIGCGRRTTNRGSDKWKFINSCCSTEFSSMNRYQNTVNTRNAHAYPSRWKAKHADEATTRSPPSTCYNNIIMRTKLLNSTRGDNTGPTIIFWSLYFIRLRSIVEIWREGNTLFSPFVLHYNVPK